MVRYPVHRAPRCATCRARRWGTGARTAVDVAARGDRARVMPRPRHHRAPPPTESAGAACRHHRRRHHHCRRRPPLAARPADVAVAGQCMDAYGHGSGGRMHFRFVFSVFLTRCARDGLVTVLHICRQFQRMHEYAVVFWSQRLSLPELWVQCTHIFLVYPPTIGVSKTHMQSFSSGNRNGRVGCATRRIDFVVWTRQYSDSTDDCFALVNSEERRCGEEGGGRTSKARLDRSPAAPSPWHSE